MDTLLYDKKWLEPGPFVNIIRKFLSDIQFGPEDDVDSGNIDTIGGTSIEEKLKDNLPTTTTTDDDECNDDGDDNDENVGGGENSEVVIEDVGVGDDDEKKQKKKKKTKDETITAEEGQTKEKVEEKEKDDDKQGDDEKESHNLVPQPKWSIWAKTIPPNYRPIKFTPTNKIHLADIEQILESYILELYSCEYLIAARQMYVDYFPRMRLYEYLMLIIDYTEKFYLENNKFMSELTAKWRKVVEDYDDGGQMVNETIGNDGSGDGSSSSSLSSSAANILAFVSPQKRKSIFSAPSEEYSLSTLLSGNDDSDKNGDAKSSSRMITRKNEQKYIEFIGAIDCPMVLGRKISSVKRDMMKISEMFIQIGGLMFVPKLTDSFPLRFVVSYLYTLLQDRIHRLTQLQSTLNQLHQQLCALNREVSQVLQPKLAV